MIKSNDTIKLKKLDMSAGEVTEYLLKKKMFSKTAEPKWKIKPKKRYSIQSLLIFHLSQERILVILASK